jgi:glycerophosphoryl diester phosphodiesterase
MSARPLNIAHRGARGHAPENTLIAARLGHAVGADMWELDTCFTRDGHLVVVHDDTLERTSDVSRRPEFAHLAPWRVDSFTLKELRSLDAGSWFGEKDPFGTVALGEVNASDLASFVGAQIPTLEEALVLTRDLNWRVNVEIKNHQGWFGHDTVTRDVTALIKKLGMENAVLLSSFQHQYLREAAELLPSTPRGALVEKPSPDLNTPASRLDGMARAESLTPEEAIAMCQQANASFFNPDKAFLDAALVAGVQARGYGVNVWTVNSPEDMQRMMEYGVFGVFTDFPARFGALL